MLSAVVGGVAFVAAFALPLCAQQVPDSARRATGTVDSAPPLIAPVTVEPVTAEPTPAATPADPASAAASATMAATDSALARVHGLVGEGKTAQARAVVDSLLRATPPQSMAYASALYARASLATNAESAESDYRRITVEYSASPRASDALLRLAQLELARGNRDQAAAHLARLTREQAPGQSGIDYARTELQVGLAYFDLQDAPHACAALTAASAAAPSSDIELRNRIDYNAQRCPRTASAQTTAAHASSKPAGPPPTKTVTAAAAAVPAAGTPSPSPPAPSAPPLASTAPPVPPPAAAVAGAVGAAGAGAAAATTAAATSATPARDLGSDAAIVTTPAETTSAAPAKATAGAAASGAAAPAKTKATAPAAAGPAKTTPVAPAAGAAAPATVAGDASHRVRPPGYTVQVAAYKTHSAAEALATNLKGRGFPVRVFGDSTPYRVRIGRYATEAQADSEARALKAKGIVGFVTAAEPLTP